VKKFFSYILALFVVVNVFTPFLLGLNTDVKVANAQDTTATFDIAKTDTTITVSSHVFWGTTYPFLNRHIFVFIECHTQCGQVKEIAAQDNHDNAQDGTATFTDLTPGTTYDIEAIRFIAAPNNKAYLDAKSYTSQKNLDDAGRGIYNDTYNQDGISKWSQLAEWSGNPYYFEVTTNKTGDKTSYNVFAKSAAVVSPPVGITPTAPGSKVSSDYTLLAPIGDMKTFTTNDIGKYFNMIFKLAIGLCIAIAVVMIVITGIQYMGDESVFGKVEAKSKITGAILGILIAVGSYALLNTIDPHLLGTDGLTIYPAMADISSDVPQAQPSQGQDYVGTSYKYKDPFPSDQSTRTKLASMGITVNTPMCTWVGQTGCASVYGLDTSFVEKLKTTCQNCQLNISEGTAFWLHTQNSLKIHYPGGFTVDLSSTPGLLKEIKSNSWAQTPKTPWLKNQNAICYSKNGMGVVEEPSHVHSYGLTGGCLASKQGV